MQIKQPRGFPQGYTPITAITGAHADLLLDFGILKLPGGGRHASGAAMERAYLLMDGEVRLEWEGGSRLIRRRSRFDEPPWCLHLPAGEDLALN